MEQVFSPKIIFLVIIVLAALLEASGDIVFKQRSISDKTSLFVVGLFVYGVSTCIWAYSLKYEFLSKAIAMITIINLICVLCISVWYFGEKLSLINMIGIGVGLISIVLMEL